MGPSTDISRSRTVPNNVGNTGPHSAGSHTEIPPSVARRRPNVPNHVDGLGAFGLSGVYQPSENQSTSRNMAVIRMASGCASMGSNR